MGEATFRHEYAHKFQVEMKDAQIYTEGRSPDAGVGPQAPGPSHGLPDTPQLRRWSLSLSVWSVPPTRTHTSWGGPWPLPSSLTPAQEPVDFKRGANSAWRKTQNLPSP